MFSFSFVAVTSIECPSLRESMCWTKETWYEWQYELLGDRLIIYAPLCSKVLGNCVVWGIHHSSQHCSPLTKILTLPFLVRRERNLTNFTFSRTNDAEINYQLKRNYVVVFANSAVLSFHFYWLYSTLHHTFLFMLEIWYTQP